MPIQKTHCIPGELLRNLRETQAVDINVLARQVNLSVRQLQQLESDEMASGERPLFYSDAIKANAAKKVALALGVNLQELTAPSLKVSSPAHELPNMQVMDDLAELLEKQERARQAGQQTHLKSSRLAGAALALCLAGALVWHFQNSFFARLSGWNFATWQTTLVSVAPDGPAREPVAAQMTAAIALPVGADQEESLSSTEALCTRPASGAVLKAATPSKAGNMVHVVAQADAAVCLQDATGKKFPMNFKSQESRSFYGAAPWTVHLDKASSVQVFFQGQRLRWPQGEQASFTLQEVQGAY